MRVFILLIICTMSLVTHAGSIKETCTKWLIEPAIFECSNGQSYAHGDAECSVSDWRPIPMNKTHGPKPKLIFCGYRKMDEAQVCVEDTSGDTEKCFTEFTKKSKERTADNKSASESSSTQATK